MKPDLTVQKHLIHTTVGKHTFLLKDKYGLSSKSDIFGINYRIE